MKKLFYVIALAALVLTSCKPDEPKIDKPEEKPNAFTFKASIEQPENNGKVSADIVASESPSGIAKATINTSNQLVWTAEDKIGIFNDDPNWNDKNQPFTLIGAGGEISGTFGWDYSSSGTWTDHATAAFFPWSDDNNVSGGNAYFNLPGSYYSYATGKMLTPLIASLSGSTDPISFKHAGAAVKVTINNVPARVHSLGMTVDGQQIYGNYHVSVANAGTEALTPNDAVNTSQNTIWINIWNGSESAWDFIFPVPPITKPKLSFQMYDDNNVLVWEKHLKAQTSDLGRADLLVMPATNITPYKHFSKSADWTFYGRINGSSFTDIPMYTDGEICILRGITFKSGDEFKIHKDLAWTESYPSSNYVVPESGAKDVFFNISTHEITLKDAKCVYPSPKVTLYFGINSAGGSGIAISSSTLAPGKEWPGLTLEDRELINGKWYYKHEVDGGTVWGKTISGVYIVGVGNWNTSNSTLDFTTIKSEYYFEATSGSAISALSDRPEEAEPATIKIDGSFDDWASVLGSTSGTSTLKAASDEDYLYFYIQRTSTPTAVWGGGGYVYIALDLDNNAATGTAVIWGSQNFEYYALFYPYAGSAEEPAFNSSPGDSAAPSPYTASNITLRGVESSGTVTYEFSIPKTDMPTIPNTPIVVKIMGNKEMSSVSHLCKL